MRERGYDGSICAMIEREARHVAALVGHLDGKGAALDVDDTVADTNATGSDPRMEEPVVEASAIHED